MKGATAATSLMDALLKDSVRKRKEAKAAPQPTAATNVPPGAYMQALRNAAIGPGEVYVLDPDHGFISLGPIRQLVVHSSVGNLNTIDIEVVMVVP